MYKSKFANDKSKMAIVWVNSTSNNTILTLTDVSGSTLAWSSGGSCGFKNSRKSTAYAAENAATKLSEKIYACGYNRISVKMKGLGRGKQKAVSALSRCGLLLSKIEEVSSIPFNGCRQKRKRRL
jgi:small subunit ribosomal protein S11